MLAGILFSFGTRLFTSLDDEPALVMAMFITYLLVRRLSPRYAVMAVLLVGCAIAAGIDTWVTPSFSWHGLFNIALPLVMVALTGQFVPGVAVLRNAGYPTRPARSSPPVAWAACCWRPSVAMA